MIVADITIVRQGTQRRVPLARVEITNDGTGTEDLGNYRWTVTNATQPDTRTGRIERFRKSHPNGAVMLVAMVLRKAFPFVPQFKPPLVAEDTAGEPVTP